MLGPPRPAAVAALVVVAVAVALLAHPVSAQSQGCVDWQGFSSAYKTTCMPHRPPLSRCGAIGRMNLVQQTRWYGVGAACCSLDDETAVNNVLITMLQKWQGGPGPGLVGRCYDMVEILHCAM